MNVIQMIKNICGNNKPLCEALSAGYDTVSNGQLFAKRDLRVLNCTHTDLDGGASAIVVQNMYPNCQSVMINYVGSPAYTNGCAAIQERADTYDAVVFSDFCPDENIISILHSLDKPYLVLDHHQTAKPVQDPNGTFVLDTTKCGALLCLDYFSQYADLEYLRPLCIVTDDHDRWLRKIIPLSDDLNSVFFLYDDFEDFVNAYKNGLPNNNLLPEDIEKLASHEQEVDEYLASRPTHSLPHNGIYLDDCSCFISDINIRLSKTYDWIVFASPIADAPEKTKLSFRTDRKDLNFGATLKDIGLGGGGHPGAAGQIIDADKVDWFIGEVVKRIFEPDAVTEDDMGSEA